MKAIPISQELTGKLSPGTMGGGMSFNNKIEALKCFFGEPLRDGKLVMIDPKGMVKAKTNATIFGTLGKGMKITTFAKEDFRPELAPERAKITEFQVDGKDYVRMVY